MKLKKVLAPAALLIALLMTAHVMAGSEFLFDGYAVYSPAPDQVGATMDVYGILSTVGGVPTPIALDMDNFEYTVHVADMAIATYDEFPAIPPIIGPRKVLTFAGGMLRIYADAIVGGTAADFAAPGTFTDGELILAATVHDGWRMQLADPFGMTFAGSGVGFCDFYGGSNLADLIEYGGQPFLENWTFAGTGISDPSFFVTVPDGYDRIFGVKLVYPEPVPTTGSSWGGVKALFD